MRPVFLLCFFFIIIVTQGQEVYKPSIVILSPFQTKYDKSLLKEIKTFDSELNPEGENEYLNSPKSTRRNIQIMDSAVWGFDKKGSFSTMFTMSLNGMITYTISGVTDLQLTFPSRDTSGGNINNLKLIARKYGVSWIVNTLSLRVYLKSGKKFASARIQVYDAENNSIVIDKEFTGDSHNPGFELSCENGSLECTIFNVISASLNDILSPILKT